MPILKFYSTNCDSCIKAQLVLEKLQQLYHQDSISIEFQDINTMDASNQQILDKYRVIPKRTILPCLVFTDEKGQEIDRINGKLNPKEVVQKIGQMLSQTGKKTPSKKLLEELKKLTDSQGSGHSDLGEDIAEFVYKANQIKKDNPLDLSSDEDLSIAIMNLISIEEHLFFTANKTQNPSYYELLKEVREVRKRSLKMIIQDYEGEVWCISKHLLAASMRLMEVGTKQLGLGKDTLAQELFADSYRMYLLFWGLNMNMINSDTQVKNSDFIARQFEENVDCCKE